MSLSQHILDSHHSQQGQAGASQGGRWEDVGGYRPLGSFHLSPRTVYDPELKHFQILLDLDGKGEGIFKQEGP